MRSWIIWISLTCGYTLSLYNFTFFIIVTTIKHTYLYNYAIIDIYITLSFIIIFILHMYI